MHQLPSAGKRGAIQFCVVVIVVVAVVVVRFCFCFLTHSFCDISRTSDHYATMDTVYAS